MKLSTVLTSALAALAIASPVNTKHDASPRSPSLRDINPPDISKQELRELMQCMSFNPNFHTDFGKAMDGVFSITNLDHTCCEKAKGIWNKIPDDRYGKAVFNQPCNGGTFNEILEPSSLHCFVKSIVVRRGLTQP